jgi:hypothetical protein
MAAGRGVEQFASRDLFAGAALALNQDGSAAYAELFELASYLQNSLGTAEKCHS